jgi:cytochrome P450
MRHLAIRDLRDDPIGVLRQIAAEQGDVAGFQLGRQRVWLLSSPEWIEAAWVRQQRHVGKWSMIRRWWVRRPPAAMDGDGLFRTHDQQKHLAQRRAVHPSFREQRLVEQTRAVADVLDGYLDQAAAQESVDLLRLAEALQVGATTAALFETPLTFEAALGLADWYEATLRASVERTFSSTAFFVKDAFGARKYFDSASGARQAMDEAVEAIVTRDADDPTALQEILRVSGVGDVSSSSQSILASSISTAVPVLRLLIALAEQPKLGVKAADETAGGPEAGVRFLDDRPWAHGLVLEAMRLGGGWQVSRLCHDDLDIDGRRFRRGDFLFVCPYLVHRDTRWYPEPEAWRPERWRPSEVASRPKLSFLTFGVGNRMCAGRELSVIGGVTLVGVLASAYRVELEKPSAQIGWHPEQSGGHVRPRHPVTGRIVRVSP